MTGYLKEQRRRKKDVRRNVPLRVCETFKHNQPSQGCINQAEAGRVTSKHLKVPGGGTPRKDRAEDPRKVRDEAREDEVWWAKQTKRKM